MKTTKSRHIFTTARTGASPQHRADFGQVLAVARQVVNLEHRLATLERQLGSGAGPKTVDLGFKPGNTMRSRSARAKRPAPDRNGGLGFTPSDTMRPSGTND